MALTTNMTPIGNPSSRGAFASLRAMISKMTWPLFFACFVTAMLNMLFGFDTTSFSGVQSIPAFIDQFGNAVKPDGSSAISAARVSFMSSVAFVGKFFGTLTCPIYVEKIGHRYTIWILCIISFVGIILECTSKTMAQFVVGRIVVYYSVGLAENTSTTYQSELVPASLRGAVVGSIQLFIQFGQIMAAGVNERFSKSKEPRGWIIPVAIQAVVPVTIFISPLFIPSGPRWLISKGRKADAVHTLERVRPKEDVAAGTCQAEADAIEEALHNQVEKGPWIDLFKGTNRRRTEIAVSVFILQQFTGQGFVSQYSPRFYKTVGLGAHAFQYNIASAVVGWVGVLIGMSVFDIVGRRNILILGGFFQAVFLFAMAGIGLKKNPTTADGNGLVACVMLFNFFFSGTWAPLAYVIASEIGTAALREKTMGFTSTINVVAAWLVAFVVPYLLDAIGSNIGWIFGAFSILAMVYAYFRVPEIMNRSLEELDELFENHVSARKFATTRTHGAAHRVAELENGPVLMGREESTDESNTEEGRKRSENVQESVVEGSN